MYASRLVLGDMGVRWCVGPASAFRALVMLTPAPSMGRGVRACRKGLESLALVAFLVPAPGRIQSWWLRFSRVVSPALAAEANHSGT